MACSGESWMTPPMSKTTARMSATDRLAGGGAHGLERDGAVGCLAQRDRHPQRAQPVHSLQLLELEVFHHGADVAEVTEVIEVAAILGGLRGLRVHDGE